MIRKALFVSPHFDDVAFSCGGTLRTLAVRGWETTLCTIFTRSVTDPTGFALACQLDKGLAPDVDYLALRRAEDDRAARALGASCVERMDLPEAPHRGYDNAPALFGAYAPTDRVANEIDDLLTGNFERYDVVFAPQALGDHVDHRRVRDAVLGVAARKHLGARVRWYRDTPYALRNGEASPDAALANAFPVKVSVPLGDAAFAAKLTACSAYASQLDFQFGGEAAMRTALRAFALHEGTYYRPPQLAESFLMSLPAKIRTLRANARAHELREA